MDHQTEPKLQSPTNELQFTSETEEVIYYQLIQPPSKNNKNVITKNINGVKNIIEDRSDLDEQDFRDDQMVSL